MRVNTRVPGMAVTPRTLFPTFRFSVAGWLPKHVRSYAVVKALETIGICFVVSFVLFLIYFLIAFPEPLSADTAFNARPVQSRRHPETGHTSIDFQPNGISKSDEFPPANSGTMTVATPWTYLLSNAKDECQYHAFQHPSLIVIGEMKCATSTLFHAIAQNGKLFPELRGTDQYEAQWYTWTLTPSLNESWLKINSEEFAWPNYRKRWSKTSEQEMTAKKLKLFEKSPPYVLLPHLAAYFRQEWVPCGARSLLIVRHPITRMWSQFWHQNEVRDLFHDNFDKLFDNSAYMSRFVKLRKAVIRFTDNEIDDSLRVDTIFAKRHSRDERELLTKEALSGTHWLQRRREAETNDEVSENWMADSSRYLPMVDTWADLSYDDAHCCQFGAKWNYYGFCCQFDVIFRSIYLPPILAWHRTMQLQLPVTDRIEDNSKHSLDRVQSSFRVLSFETIFRDGISTVIQQLRCWLDASIQSDDINDARCNEKYGGKTVPKRQMQKKHMSATKGRKIPPRIEDAMVRLFQPVNDPLFAYLHRYPSLILGQATSVADLY